VILAQAHKLEGHGRGANASIHGEGCASTALVLRAGHISRAHRLSTCTRRIASSICPHLSYDRHRPSALPSGWGAIHTRISSSAPRGKLRFLRTRLGRIIDGAASSGYDGISDTSPCQPSPLSVQNGLRKHAMRPLCHIDHLSHADIGREAAQRVGVLF